MRRMALVDAATLISELGDLSRFPNGRQLMAYLRLAPSEQSSGASVRRGGITKAGNSGGRRLLIEAAWIYCFPGRLTRELLSGRKASPSRSARSPGTRSSRLCARYRKLAIATQINCYTDHHCIKIA